MWDGRGLIRRGRESKGKKDGGVKFWEVFEEECRLIGEGEDGRVEMRVGMYVGGEEGE